MTEQAKIPLAGLIGHPAAHSRSPALHGFWLKEYQIPGHYIPMDVMPDDLEEVLQVLPKAGFVGCNVTIPHKEAVLQFADVISDRAALIGAANTLIFLEGGKIYADNTDGYGFVCNMKEAAPHWAPGASPAAIVGAGGAARAVISSLLELGCPEIRISNRTRVRADRLREEFGARLVVYDWAQAGNMFDGAHTVVNTTSLGMVGKDPFSLPLDALDDDAIVMDAVYTPLRTEFLQIAVDKGCVAVDGLGMLLHQAVPGFERWFGIRPEVTPMLREAVLNA